MSQTGRPFAVFDIDGTLIRWQLYHALADELAGDGLLNPRLYQQALEARMDWKKRTSHSSFETYEEVLVKAVNAAIAHITPEQFGAACAQVIKAYRDQVYTYTRSLLQAQKAQGYLLFAISASQAEIVGHIADYYGFDDFGGTHYVVRDGRFTGETQVLIRNKKPEVLRQLVAQHDATWEGSIGIGDSESDIQMLETVEQPIAFNPTGQLLDHARQHHWRIVLERKNVVYELEPQQEKYILAN